MEKMRYKMLLIEDNDLDQEAFERLVKDEQLPYEYTIAGSVAEAKSVLASQKFDIVISDYALGDGTAFDVLNMVDDTPTVIVTGIGNEEVAVKTWRAGACDYLIKDLELNYLKALPVTVENVLRHRKVEEKVRLLSGAVMSTDDSVYITDMDNKIIFVNRAFCESYGYEEQEVIGKDSNILWMGKQQKGTRSVFQMVSSAWEVGFYHKRKDGRIFPVSLTRSIIKDAVGKEIAVIGVARDISEYITMEDELRTANQTLERRSLLKSELAVAVSEELKTLMAEIENVVSDAVSGKSSSSLKENMESALKNINNAEDIINDFLEISNIDTNKIEMEKTEFDLCSIAREVVETLAALASGKNIKLESSIPDSEFIVEADRDKIAQAITHLINHSINTVPDTSRINVRLEDHGNEVTVEVEDDGSIIEGGQMSKVFNRFDQIRAQLRAGKEELLLDLPIARDLIEIHGGWILAEGKGDKGNSFRFTLPKQNLQSSVASAGTKRAGKES
ncbi:MAG: PAS domain S-box protein [Sedimentisphaerales bacterium]|nr:PAS domain S-box protein [Sedimentisphaerales bacterium]